MEPSGGIIEISPFSETETVSIPAAESVAQVNYVTLGLGLAVLSIMLGSYLYFRNKNSNKLQDKSNPDS